jgi:hypothetical protein
MGGRRRQQLSAEASVPCRGLARAGKSEAAPTGYSCPTGARICARCCSWPAVWSASRIPLAHALGDSELLLHRSYSFERVRGGTILACSSLPFRLPVGILDMGDKRSFLDASANGKATLTTSQRSFIAGWKLCAGVGLGLYLAGRSSSARAVCTAPAATKCGSPSCFLPETRIKTTGGEINIEELRIGESVLTASGEAMPIKFIGRRRVLRERAGPWNGDGPVKISRFAIDGKATPFAPIVRYRSSRQELASHMRSAFAPVHDFRKPIEKVRDRILDRLEFAGAA